MIPYIIVCIITLFLAHIADKFYNVSLIKCTLPLLCIVALNTIFAGARDFGVGIDTIVYIDEYFINGSFIKWKEFILNEEGADRGFLLLGWIASHISNDSQSLMFLTELFIIGFTALGAYNAKKVLDFSFVSFFLVFFLLLYAQSLNIMRQYCAMALLFYGYTWMLRGNYLAPILTQILAYFFHTSSVIFLVIPFLHIISGTKGRKKIYYAILLFAGAFCFMALYYYILLQIGDMGILKDVYSERYGAGSKYEAETSFSISLLFRWRYVLPLLLPMLVVISGKMRNIFTERESYFAIVITAFAIIVEQMQFIMTFFGRLSYYYIYIYIIYLAIVFSSKKSLKPLNFIYVLFFTYWWYYVNIDVNKYLWGWNFDYTSKILGI